jgi:hypothetical protein
MVVYAIIKCQGAWLSMVTAMISEYSGVSGVLCTISVTMNVCSEVTSRTNSLSSKQTSSQSVGVVLKSSPFNRGQSRAASSRLTQHNLFPIRKFRYKRGLKHQIMTGVGFRSC